MCIVFESNKVVGISHSSIITIETDMAISFIEAESEKMAKKKSVLPQKTIIKIVKDSRCILKIISFDRCN